MAGAPAGGVASAALLAATATISSAPNGVNFDYTVNLTDTGSTWDGANLTFVQRTDPDRLAAEAYAPAGL